MNRRRAPWRYSAVCAGLLILASACGGQVTDTPNPTAVAAHGATVLASLPTAESLTPQPSKTALPTGAPVSTVQTTITAEPIMTAGLITVTGAISSSAPVTSTEPVTIIATATSAITATLTISPTAPPAASDYTVQDGDTLLSIAMAYHVSMASIMLLNDMGDSQVVKLGQALHIPPGKTWPDENTFWFVYIVQPGEALSTIASRFNVNTDDLVRVNKLADASAIRVDQNLIIPAAAFTQNTPPEPTSSPRVEAVSEQVAAAQEAPTEAPVARSAAQAQPAPAVAAKVAPVAGVEAMRAEILALYNQARVSAGLAPLAGSGILQVAAQGQAEDDAQRGYGSHTGSDGSTPRVRILRAGYPGSITGENWAWGHSATEVFDMWFYQESSGGPHRSNILSTRYTEVGFGIAAASGGYYFIADFGAP